MLLAQSRNSRRPKAPRYPSFPMPDRRSEKKPEIVGPYPELAHLVLQITGNVARAVAARRSGVSHDTIARLWAGERSNEATLIRFAVGYGIDPNPLFKAAGYQEIPELSILARQANGSSSSAVENFTVGEIQGEPVVVTIGKGATAEERQRLLDAFRDAVGGDGSG